MLFDPSKSCSIQAPSVPLSLRVKRLWLKSVPKATPTKRLFATWGFPVGYSTASNPAARRNPKAGIPVFPAGGASPSSALRLTALAHSSQPSSLSWTACAALPPPLPPRIFCIRTRASPASGRAGGAREAARARPDSWALLAPLLVPGFRAQHGGQGDSNSLLLPLLHKRHSGAPAWSPSPLPISFFAWFLDCPGVPARGW